MVTFVLTVIRRHKFNTVLTSLQEQETVEVRQLRQSLQFKARPAPPRSRPPFEPDYRLAKPPTEPAPFVLATSIRFDVDDRASSVKSASPYQHHVSQNSGDDEFEDDEDLDDGSGCTDLSDSRTLCAAEPPVACAGMAIGSHITGAGHSDAVKAAHDEQMARKQHIGSIVSDVPLVREHTVTSASVDCVPDKLHGYRSYAMRLMGCKSSDKLQSDGISEAVPVEQEVSEPPCRMQCDVMWSGPSSAPDSGCVSEMASLESSHKGESHVTSHNCKPSDTGKFSDMDHISANSSIWEPVSW